MARREVVLTLLAATVPALVALLVGLTHPGELNGDTAQYWRDIHLVLLPVFPLIGFGPWLLVRRIGGWWAAAAAIGGFLFAVFYTALDVLAGIAAGTVYLAEEPDAIGSLFRIGDALAPVGVVGLAAGFAVATVAIARRRIVAVPGGILAVLGAALILPGHVWFPIGTLALALVIAGTVVLLMAGKLGYPEVAERSA
jgi:hypothetical protein